MERPRGGPPPGQDQPQVAVQRRQGAPEFSRDGGRVTDMTFIDSEVYVPHLIEIIYA